MRHPIFARLYERASPAVDRTGMAQLRDRLLSGLSGRVIEVGAGNGLNFARYPHAVTAVLAVEPEPFLRRTAARRARAAPVPVHVVGGEADHLPAVDASFDGAVASLALCSVPDQARALAELMRVLRPGGRLRFLEHVRAETSPLMWLQRVADATVWPHFGGGCHTGRDTVAAIEAAGFTIEECARFRFPDRGLPPPAAPHVLGTARRPAG